MEGKEKEEIDKIGKKIKNSLRSLQMNEKKEM